MMLNDPTILTFVIIANVLAVGMTYLAWKQPDWARLLFSINFIGAAVFNGVFWYIEPEEYSYYSEFVWFESYRNFILGPFLGHLRLFLGMIVVYQLFVGFGLLSTGKWRQSAILLGLLFLVAIAPFGLGAAFPATLIQSVGLFLVFLHTRAGHSPISTKADQ